jgi:hypothetical protein
LARDVAGDAFDDEVLNGFLAHGSGRASYCTI